MPHAGNMWQIRYCLIRSGDRSRGAAIAVFGCILAIASGIGCGSVENTGKVSGTITVNGTAAGPGTIMFDPLPGDGPIGPSAIGHFGTDGQYRLMLPGNKEGAFIGEYRVMILAGVKEEYGDEGAPSARGPSKINIRYEDIKHSGLKANVESGNNVINFDLKP
jgi:hypothetical protein